LTWREHRYAERLSAAAIGSTMPAMEIRMKLRGPSTTPWEVRLSLGVSRKAFLWGTIALAVVLPSGCSRKSKSDNQTGPGFLSNVQGSANPSNGGSNAGANSGTGSTSSGQTVKVISVALPQGTVLDVTLDEAMSTTDAQRGEAFGGKVSRAVEANGGVVIPAGTHVHGSVVQAHAGGQADAPASLVLELSDVEMSGATIQVRTSRVTKKGQADAKRTAAGSGAGAAAGGFFGGLAAKSKGAIKGAKTGASTGAAVTASVTNKDISIGTELVLAFRLEQPVSIVVKQ
jgi:hypothetical protein